MPKPDDEIREQLLDTIIELVPSTDPPDEAVQQAMRRLDERMAHLIAAQNSEANGDVTSPTQPAVRLVPDVPTELADGVSRGTHPIEQPPSRRYVRRRCVAMFQSRRARWSVAAAVAAAVVLAVGLWPGKPGKSGNGSGVAFAQVIEQMMSARTVAFTMDYENLESKKSTTSQVKCNGPGRQRMEQPDGSVMIFDMNARKCLTLIPSMKKAMRADLVGGTAKTPTADVWDRVHELRGAASEDLGQQQIDGRTVTGFRAKVGGFEWTLWVDPATELPVLIELTLTGSKSLMRDFAFNVPMDESLFSVEAPAGYTLDVQQIDMTKTPEERFIETLGVCADANGGLFPDKLDNNTLKNLGKEMIAKRQAKFPKETPMQIMQNVIIGFTFFKIMPADSDWHYAGTGVKLGAADVPISWWKPTDSPTYRVVFGDLSVRDLDKADVDRLTAQIPKSPGG